MNVSEVTSVTGELVSEVSFLLAEEGSGLSFLINSTKQFFRGCRILEVCGFSEPPNALAKFLCLWKSA